LRRGQRRGGSGKQGRQNERAEAGHGDKA
jgi:hypothetical protein